MKNGLLATTAALPDNIAADTLVGAAAISTFIGKTLRQTNYLLEMKQLPAYRLGKRWHLRKSTFAAFIAKREAEALKTADAA